MSCPDPVNNGVNDFSIMALKNVVSTVGGINANQTIYSIFWTCKTVALGV